MLKPLGDRVVLKVEEKKNKQLVVLSFAGAGKESTQTATVVAVGTGARTLTGELVTPSVAAGDKVIIETGAGVEVKDGDDAVTIVHEAEILAVLA